MIMGRRLGKALAIAAAAIAVLLVLPASSSLAATAWVDGHAHRSRLVAGAVPTSTGIAYYVGFEIELANGWKTYWRNPGDAGGIPPSFDLSRSRNVARSEVHYPAPHRLVDETGTTLGYKKHVTFPVGIEPADPTRPVTVALTADFGVCEKICVPARAEHAITFTPSQLTTVPPALSSAIARIPVGGDAATAAGLPRLAAAKADLEGSSPELVFDVDGGADQANLDLLIETPEGIVTALPKRRSQEGQTVRFAVAIEPRDAAALAGKPVRLTMIGANGAAETEWTVPR